MVCLPLSDTDAPLERLAGWRLVFFVVLELSLCIAFSARPPPDTPQLRLNPRHPAPAATATEPVDGLAFMCAFPLYRQPSWVQDLLPTLGEEKPSELKRENKEASLDVFNMLLENNNHHYNDSRLNSVPPCAGLGDA